MKQLLLLISILSFCSIETVGQPRIQQVVVKTKGSLMDNGKVKPGVRLSNVLVAIKDGNIWASNDCGEFAFTVNPDNVYVINMVKKEGYTLVDPEMIGRRLGHTVSPLFIVLETQAERMRQQLDMEFKLRTVLMNKIKEKESEIEELKIAHAITENEYRVRIRALYEEQERHPMLVESMAKEYANIDFDQANDFDRQFAHFLLNGELDKADSLLATRGKIEDDIIALNNHREENATMREELRKSEAYEKFNSKKVADFCMSKYSLHIEKNQLDSAIYYIEKRAECDTTNVKWQYEAASIIYNKSSNCAKAKVLYERALRHAELQYGANDPCTMRIRREIDRLHTCQ